MYERMLNKQAAPAKEEMAEYCAENAERVSMINGWLTTAFSTEQKAGFPHGNQYGRGIGHYPMGPDLFRNCGTRRNRFLCSMLSSWTTLSER